MESSINVEYRALWITGTVLSVKVSTCRGNEIELVSPRFRLSRISGSQVRCVWRGAHFSFPGRRRAFSMLSTCFGPPIQGPCGKPATRPADCGRVLHGMAQEHLPGLPGAAGAAEVRNMRASRPFVHSRPTPRCPALKVTIAHLAYVTCVILQCGVLVDRGWTGRQLGRSSCGGRSGRGGRGRARRNALWR